MFITYKEVRSYVERAKPGSTIGQCGSPGYCLIAEAVRQKYPEARDISVSLASDTEVVYIHMYSAAIRGSVTTGDDGHKLYLLGQSFDELGGDGYLVSREQALELFQ